MLRSLTILAAVLSIAALPAAAQYDPPRLAGGQPDFNGIWSGPSGIGADIQAAQVNGQSVIVDPSDGKIPYLAAAAAKQRENLQKRAQSDPVGHCFMPGVPRLMYLPGDPFRIVETPGFVAILSQFMHNVRNIPVDGSKHLENIDLWSGDSRGSWEGDILVVDTTDFNDRTWFDAAGDHHSGELHVVERFARTGPTTITYQATLTDPQVFSKPWTMRLPLTLNTDKNAQILEDECNYKQEGPTVTEGTMPDPHREAKEREGKAREGQGAPPAPPPGRAGDGRGGLSRIGGAAAAAAAPVPRLPDGHPDLQGYWDARGSLFSIEATAARKEIGVFAGRGIITDPADGKIPYQPWAREKEIDLSENHTIEESDAHCYPSGIPHMMEAQSSFQILQPAGYVVMIWEYMHNYRIIPTDNRPHVLPASVHLFAGDSKGHWEGDTLVVDVTNQNARTWFDIAANFHSDQIHVVERITPLDANRIHYEAVITDPKVYTRPWKVEFDIIRNREAGYRNMEFACWEGEHDVTEKYTLDSQGADPAKGGQKK